MCGAERLSCIACEPRYSCSYLARSLIFAGCERRVWGVRRCPSAKGGCGGPVCIRERPTLWGWGLSRSNRVPRVFGLFSGYNFIGPVDCVPWEYGECWGRGGLLRCEGGSYVLWALLEFGYQVSAVIPHREGGCSRDGGGYVDCNCMP